MMIPSSLQSWLTEQKLGSVTTVHPVTGGCINNGMRVVTSTGQSFFLKTNPHCPPDMFEREAEGLTALTVPNGPRIPCPFVFGENFLLLEDLAPTSPVRDYGSVLGRQLAILHNHTSPQFGFDHDNYIGSTPQMNPWTEDGYVFFAQHRLMFQAERARRQNLLSSQDIHGIRKLADQLPGLIPRQPASLIHGDLWSGNIVPDQYGFPTLIDPATHFGWAEADLAMMTLFGAPPREFFLAYQEVRPLPPGLEERFPIYNLYHLLNHLNLFGKGYYRQVIAIIESLG